MEHIDAIIEIFKMLVLPIASYAIYELRKLRDSTEKLTSSLKGIGARLDGMEKMYDHRFDRLEAVYDGPDRRRH